MADQKPMSLIEGTLAQGLGMALGTLIVLTLAAFNHFLPAGYESALGSFLSIVFYLGWHRLRGVRRAKPNP